MGKQPDRGNKPAPSVASQTPVYNNPYNPKPSLTAPTQENNSNSVAAFTPPPVETQVAPPGTSGVMGTPGSPGTGGSPATSGGTAVGAIGK